MDTRWFTLRGKLERYGEGWNSADVEGVLDCFTPGIRYRDLAVNRWLVGGEQLRRYVEKVFRRFPEQRWYDIEVWPHTEEGAFSVGYQFRMASAKEEMRGGGYERIVIEDGRICLDDVLLRADALHVRVPILDAELDVLGLLSAPRRLKRSLLRLVSSERAGYFR